MKRVKILCEGQTEEAFVDQVLYYYFFGLGISVRPIIYTTSRAKGKKHKGGADSYQKILRELIILCREDKGALITTLFDLYGFPEDTTRISSTHSNFLEEVREFEERIESDVSEPNCLFNFVVHEFEALLFSNPEVFIQEGYPNPDKIKLVKDSYPSPEHINNSWETAPSKRLQKLIPNYKKVLDGSRLAEGLGIDVMMEECKHFSSWVERIKKYCLD